MAFLGEIIYFKKNKKKTFLMSFSFPIFAKINGIFNRDKDEKDFLVPLIPWTSCSS